MARRPTHAQLASLADRGEWTLLWAHALPITRQIVAELARKGRIPPSLAEDALQTAYLAAGQAVRLWRPLDATLSACLSVHVRGAVYRLLAREPRNLDSLDEEGEEGPVLDDLVYADPPEGFDDPLSETLRIEVERRVRAAIDGLRSRTDRDILSAIYGLNGDPISLEAYAGSAGLRRRDAYYILSEAKRRLAKRLRGLAV